MKVGAEMTSWFHAKLARIRAAKLGRIRVSTVVLIASFAALFWVYQTFPPQPTGSQLPETVVVPPGFVPDPNYTWVPRTNVFTSEPSTTTTPTSPTETTSPDETTSTSPTESTPTSPTTTSPRPDESVSPSPTTSAASTSAGPETPTTVPAR